MHELVTKEDLRINNQLLVQEIIIKLGAMTAAAIAATGVLVKMLFG